MASWCPYSRVRNNKPDGTLGKHRIFPICMAHSFIELTPQKRLRTGRSVDESPGARCGAAISTMRTRGPSTDAVATTADGVGLQLNPAGSATLITSPQVVRCGTGGGGAGGSPQAAASATATAAPADPTARLCMRAL